MLRGGTVVVVVVVVDVYMGTMGEGKVVEEEPCKLEGS